MSLLRAEQPGSLWPPVRPHLPLRPLSEVAHEVLLPHEQVHEAREGGGDCVQKRGGPCVSQSGRRRDVPSSRNAGPGHRAIAVGRGTEPRPRVPTVGRRELRPRPRASCVPSRGVLMSATFSVSRCGRSGWCAGRGEGHGQTRTLSPAPSLGLFKGPPVPHETQKLCS